MRRLPIAPRPDAVGRLARSGCHFSEMYGQPYMWETMSQPAVYALETTEVNKLVAATQSVHEVAKEVAHVASASEAAMATLRVPEHYRDVVMESFRRGDPALYQRMDLGFDPRDGQFKLLEYNGDTPTGVVEMNCYADWYEDALDMDLIPPGAKHCNDFRRALTHRLSQLRTGASADTAITAPMYFAAARGLVEEENTVAFMRQCAEEAGLDARFIYLDELGVDAAHNFADTEDYVVEALFKLFPWEDIAVGPYSTSAAHTMTCQFFEPAWKMMWSNKAFLVLAWELFEGHPHLLPAFFEDDPRAKQLPRAAVKPQWGREGQNTDIVEEGDVTESLTGEYEADVRIAQELVALPSFDGRYPVFGSWVIDDVPAGILIREDRNRITSNLSNCIAHYYE